VDEEERYKWIVEAKKKEAYTVANNQKTKRFGILASQFPIV
jgi:hypothetical protein